MYLVWTLLLNIPLGLAAWLVARHGFRQSAGLPRALAAATLAWTWVVVGMAILGVFGLLARTPLLGWSMFGLAVGAWLRWRDRKRPADPPRLPERWGWDAKLALALMIMPSLIYVVVGIAGTVADYTDAPIYHLYFAVRWWKAGRLFLVATPFGDNATTYFPCVGELGFCWLIVGWGGEPLAKIGQAPFLLAAAFAAFGMARRLGAGIGASAIAVGWFVCSTVFLSLSFQANVDTIFVAGYLLAAYFFLAYARGDGEIAPLVLGGLAAGGALGTKPTGVVFVPVLLASAVFVVLLRRATRKRKVHDVLIVLCAPLVMGGYWYGRNAWLTGNPLYPLQVQLFGHVLLPGWFPESAMHESVFFTSVRKVRELIDLLLAVLDPREAPIWLLAVCGAWSWGRRGQSDRAAARNEQTTFAAPQGEEDARGLGGASSENTADTFGRTSPLAPSPPERFASATRGLTAGIAVLATANIALFWLLIPYRTIDRFIFHALGLAAVPLARTLDRSFALRVLGLALLFLHLFTPAGWPFVAAGKEPPWDLTPRIPNGQAPLIGLPITRDLFHHTMADPHLRFFTGMNIAYLLCAPLIAWVWSRSGALARFRAALVTLAVIVFSAAAMSARTSDPRQSFYPGNRYYLSGWLELEQRAGPSGVRIAYAGTNQPYYLFGMHLRNDVRYINVDAHRDWLMHDYHRAASAGAVANWPNPRVNWSRLAPDYDAWLANLRAARTQILVVVRIHPFERSTNVADSERFPIERRWAESHPGTFVPLYGIIEQEKHIRLYGLRPSHSRRSISGG